MLPQKPPVKNTEEFFILNLIQSELPDSFEMVLSAYVISESFTNSNKVFSFLSLIF